MVTLSTAHHLAVVGLLKLRVRLSAKRECRVGPEYCTEGSRFQNEVPSSMLGLFAPLFDLLALLAVAPATASPPAPVRDTLVPLPLADPSSLILNPTPWRPGKGSTAGCPPIRRSSVLKPLGLKSRFPLLDASGGLPRSSGTFHCLLVTWCLGARSFRTGDVAGSDAPTAE